MTQENDDSVSNISARQEIRSSVGILKRDSISTLSKDRESVAWVNDLLAVFYEAWTDSKVFHKLVLDSIYNAVNLDRD